MAGYIFALDKDTPVEKYISKGIYGTHLKDEPDGSWHFTRIATFGDFVTMKPGDNVYFFSQRKIYGVGELVSIYNQQCSFLNFPQANIPHKFIEKYNDIQSSLLINEGKTSLCERWICAFRPSPFFFRNGVDMDDALLSRPESFRMLRAFQGRSFIKIDDQENQALKDFIFRKNQECLKSSDPTMFFPTTCSEEHEKIRTIICSDPEGYKLSINDIVTYDSNGQIKVEMALEVGLLFQIANLDPGTVASLGNMDFLSQQVIASPFKPIIYTDKMDIFGYRYIPGYPSTISKYAVIEVKKGKAKAEDIDQVMRYVDWIRDEYAGGDYSMIEAFLVAFEFSEEALSNLESKKNRNYTVGTNPAISKVWTNLQLVQYKYDPINHCIVLS